MDYVSFPRLFSCLLNCLASTAADRFYIHFDAISTQVRFRRAVRMKSQIKRSGNLARLLYHEFLRDYTVYTA